MIVLKERIIDVFRAAAPSDSILLSVLAMVICEVASTIAFDKETETVDRDYALDICKRVLASAAENLSNVQVLKVRRQ